jgi:DNA-binding XRE family transcriptional regulator
MKQIEYIRRKKGLSQSDLGKIIGVSQKCISHLETGKKQVGYAVLCSISKYFKWEKTPIELLEEIRED